MITRTLLSVMIPLMPFALAARGINAKLIPIETAYSATSVNVAVFRANSVYTHDSTQYVAFYDADGYVTLGKRTLGTNQWTINHTPYLGNVKDAHNVISFIVDDEDIIHISFDHHGDSLKYCRSVAPGSLQLGPFESMTGDLEHDVTYPEFYRLNDGSLLFAYRSGASGRGNLVLNRYNPVNHTWSRLHDSLIDGENERNAYWQLHVDSHGTIHLSWVWRETWMVETNHDLCYACSYDNGKTWVRSDGSPYSLPITVKDAEIACPVPQSSELINQTSMSADADGHPYIATYWRDANDSVPQYRLVWYNGISWNHCTVGHRSTPFTLAGGGTKMIPISRPRMVIDGNTVYYVVRDIERNSVVTLHMLDLANRSESIYDLTDFSVEAWEPTLDQSLWMKSKRLHLYVQNAGQGDGEQLSTVEPQQAYILEVLD